jgi:hypothetical protein
MFGKNQRPKNPIELIDEQIKRNEEMIKTLQSINDKLKKQRQSVINKQKSN